MADDAGVRDEAIDIGLAESRYLRDVETGEGGPRWGAGGPDAAALLDAHHSPT